jgi:hypothetical protein
MPRCEELCHSGDGRAQDVLWMKTLIRPWYLG